MGGGGIVFKEGRLLFVFAHQKPNSWMYNFVQVSGHNLGSSQDFGFLDPRTGEPARGCEPGTYFNARTSNDWNLLLPLPIQQRSLQINILFSFLELQNLVLEITHKKVENIIHHSKYHSSKKVLYTVVPFANQGGMWKGCTVKKS